MPPRNPSQGDPRDSAAAPPQGEGSAVTDDASVAKTDTPPSAAAVNPPAEPPAPPPAEPAVVSEPEAESAPSLDDPPYAEQHQPEGWDPPVGRPPLGEVAEANAPKED